MRQLPSYTYVAQDETKGMTSLEHALQYLGLGWSVFALIPGSKRPAVPIKDLLSGAERWDEATVYSYWGMNPGAGVGVVTGRPSNLAVVDIDVRNGGDMDLAADFGFVVCSRSGRGSGGHLFCKLTDPELRGGKTGRLGVDLKANGGYVVAPPSIHPDTGRAYKWVNGPEVAPLGTLPAWALEKPTPTSSGGEPGARWIADALAHPEAVPSGAQEESLTKLAWALAARLPEDIAHAILWAWVGGLVKYRSDPWEEEHVRVRLASAYTKHALSPAAPPPIPGIVDDTPLRMKRISDLEFPEQPWIVEDFVAPGACTEIIGKVKKGKSTLVYQLLNAVRTGEPFLGRATLAGGAVVLTEQTGTSLKKTLERAGLLGTDSVYVMQKGDIKAAGGFPSAVAQATEQCRRLGIRLIIVDTLSRLAGLGGESENQAGAVSVLDPFTEAREMGVACVFVRHARKGQNGVADDIADAARGSSAITGDMDIVIRLAPSGDLRLLSWESRITDDPDDVYLQYQNGTYVVVDEPDSPGQVRQDDRRAAMAQALLDNPGASTKELQDKLGWGSAHTVIKYRKAVLDSSKPMVTE